MQYLVNTKFHLTRGKLISHCHTNMTQKAVMKNKKNILMKNKGGGEKLLTFIMLDI